jgi:hypothetical protein
MAKQSFEKYLLSYVRSVEKAEAFLAYRTQVLRDHATDLSWPDNLVNSLKMVDDGTGNIVAMNGADKEEIRNLEYPMPGKPAKPAITTFYYGLGEF